MTRQNDGELGLEFIGARKGDTRESDKKGKGAQGHHEWMTPDPEEDEGHELSHRLTPPPVVPQQENPGASGSIPKGPAEEVPEEGSPAQHSSTKKMRMAFLKTLSDNREYQAMLKDMERVKVRL